MQVTDAPPKQTPWGYADQQEQLADGIWYVGVPSRGMYWLTPERIAEMPRSFRYHGPWYQKKDVSYNLVYLAFPNVFPDSDLKVATKILVDHMPDTMREAGYYFPDSESQELRQRAFYEDNKHNYVVTGAHSSSAYPSDIPDGMVGVVAQLGAGRARDSTDSKMPRIATRVEDAMLRVVSQETLDAAVINNGSHASVNLSKSDLRGRSLAGADLTNADFTGSNLRGVDLRGTILTGAIFRGADLAETNWTEVDAERIDARDANFTRAILDAADIRGARFDNAVMNDVVLGRADAREANFSDASMRNVDFRKVTLDRARFNNTFLHKANFRGVQLVDVNMSEAQLPLADLSEAAFRNVNLTWCDLSSANLEHALLDFTDCWKSRFANASLNGAALAHADLSDADLRHADLRSTDLRGTQFRHAKLTGAVVFGADAQGADFEHADLNEVDLRDMVIHEANFSQAKLRGSPINARMLSEATFSVQHERLADTPSLDPGTAQTLAQRQRLIQSQELRMLNYVREATFLVRRRNMKLAPRRALWSTPLATTGSTVPASLRGWARQR